MDWVEGVDVNMGEEQASKKYPQFQILELLALIHSLAFSHTHTILKLHKHSLGVVTFFMENNGEGRAGRQGIRGLWSQIVQIRGNGMGSGLLLEIRTTGRTTTSTQQTWRFSTK